MTTGKCIKSVCGLALLLLILPFVSACGSGREKADGPTATVGGATATSVSESADDHAGDGSSTVTSRLAGLEGTGGDSPVTTPPTIVFDDSAAAAFWPTRPEGMTPAEFSPNTLTREELVRYKPLPDPDPAAWDIPAEGVTEEYAARIFTYVRTLQLAILKVGVVIGADDPRVQGVVPGPYAGRMQDQLRIELREVQADADRGGVNWSVLVGDPGVEVVDDVVTVDGYPCAYLHLTYQTRGSADGEVLNLDEWVGMVRDAPPNSLNPSGWRLISMSLEDDGTARCITQ